MYCTRVVVHCSKSMLYLDIHVFLYLPCFFASVLGVMLFLCGL